MRHYLAILAALAAFGAYAVTATKDYVDRGDAATLQAAKEYTDQHGGGGGGEGTVKSVNGQEPDENGEVVLSAADVGALSVAGGTVEGNLTVNDGVSVPQGEIETMSITYAGHGGGHELNNATWSYYPDAAAEGNREIAVKGDITDAISPESPAFANAVLAVGLNIDTDSVAVLNAIAATFGDFPIAGTATTVGGLLAALAAAVAWLKKNKVGQFEVDEAKAELNARIDIIEATSHPNMGIVGSPTFREGVVSGFSANDYLIFPTEVSVGENAVDFFMSFTTGANVTAQQNILDSWCGLAFAIQNGGTVTAASQNGTTFETATSAGTISANTAYRLKLEFRHENGAYTVATFLATGSGDYAQIGGVVTLTAPVFPTATYWGGANPMSGVSHVFGGSINLAECRMDWNDKTVWRGYNEKPTYQRGVREDGSPADQELHDFFRESNGLLAATIDARLPYPINTAGTIIDRNVNVVTSGAFVIPEGFKDLLIRYTGTPTSLTFSGADASVADWGDDLPTASGDYLITVTRIAAAECYIRIIKLEERA